MLATKTKLQEELDSYKNRVDFLKKFTNFIFTNEYASELEEFQEEMRRLMNKFGAKKGGLVDKPLGPGGKK